MTVISQTGFDWNEELHKTVVKSLVTSFGLDFILLDDKKGGDVDTIHNVRRHQKGESDIYVSNQFKNDYKNKEDYKPIKKNDLDQDIYDKNGKVVKEDKYHSDPRYRNKGEQDKKLHERGSLMDEYRGQNMSLNEDRQLDHIISSHEIHNDSGRVLAGIKGVDLANQDSNLQSTHAYINNIKKEHSAEKFVNEIIPKTIENKKENIRKNQEKIDSMPSNTAQQLHEKRKIEDEIRKDKERIQALESIDKEKMINADKKARKDYNYQLNKEYYTGTKFLKNTAVASLNTGFRMGMREALGLIFAEIWFELKDEIPKIYKKVKHNFDIKVLLSHIKDSLISIFKRIEKRFNDIIMAFKDSAIGGIMSSVTTTILNIFLTTEKMIVRLIREMWNSLVNAAKLIFFNPQKLALGDLAREVTRILSTGIAVVIGVLLNQHLMTIMTFPFGTEIAAFLSALATGILTVCMSYFLDHSELMDKVWSFLNKFKTEYKRTLEYFQKVNAELDRYLIELSRIEFNMLPSELETFADNLLLVNSEHERGLILAAEVKRRNIDLPFESGNTESTRSWLAGLSQKKS